MKYFKGSIKTNKSSTKCIKGGKTWHRSSFFFLNIYYIKYEIYELHDDTKLNYRKEHKSTSTHLYDNKMMVL